jgi:hypothetical protein
MSQLSTSWGICGSVPASVAPMWCARAQTLRLEVMATRSCPYDMLLGHADMPFLRWKMTLLLCHDFFFCVCGSGGHDEGIELIRYTKRRMEAVDAAAGSKNANGWLD